MTRDPDPSCNVQRDADGRLRHLITLEGLSAGELTDLLDLAQFYVRDPRDLPARDQSLSGHTVASAARVEVADEQPLPAGHGLHLPARGRAAGARADGRRRACRQDRADPLKTLRKAPRLPI